ncbi:MAG: CHASE2 domain-containing protein, partial [Cyanobacteria bacterium]|nr:CHASE2 domain-containing protein [Cyanobacteriota bacterium]
MLFKALKKEWVTVEGPPLIGSRLYEAYQVPIPQLLTSPSRIYPLDNLLYDVDGKVRRFVMLGRGKKGFTLPTIPVAVAMAGNRNITVSESGEVLLRPKPNPLWVDLNGEKFPIIRWYGNENASSPVYPKYSFWKIIKSQLAWECQDAQIRGHSRLNPSQSSVCSHLDFKGFTPLDPTFFKNKFVLAGYNSNWYDSNRHSTLYGSKEEEASYPNLYIQANILDNILHNDFVGRLGWRIPSPFLQDETISLGTPLIGLFLLALVFAFTQRFPSVPLSLGFVVALCVFYSSVTLYVYEHYNLWLNWIYPILTVVIGFVGIYLFRYQQAEHRKKQLRLTFAKYISPVSMEYIEKNPDSVLLGSQRRELTFLFCDIRGFTTFAEQMPTEVVQSVLSDYFAKMNAIILHRYGGVINKLMGDAILAYWGFPLESPEDPVMAVSAALAMKEAIDGWSQDHGQPP